MNYPISANENAEIIPSCMFCYATMEHQLNSYLDRLNFMFFKLKLLFFVFSLIVYIFLEHFGKGISEYYEKNYDNRNVRVYIWIIRGLSIGCFASVLVVSFMNFVFDGYGLANIEKPIMTNIYINQYLNNITGVIN